MAHCGKWRWRRRSHRRCSPSQGANRGIAQKSYPTNTQLRLYRLPTIDAAVEIKRSKSSQAIVDLETPAPYELGEAGTLINDLYRRS